MALQQAISHGCVGDAVGEPVGCAVGGSLGDGVGKRVGDGVVGADVLGMWVGETEGCSVGGVLGLVGIHDDHHGDDNDVREHSLGRSKALYTDGRLKVITNKINVRK